MLHVETPRPDYSKVLEGMSGFVFVEEFLGMGKVGLGFPSVFRGGITFPRGKVSTMAGSSSMSEDLFNFVFFFRVH